MRTNNLDASHAVKFKCDVLFPSSASGDEEEDVYDEKYVLLRVLKGGKTSWLVRSRIMAYHSDIVEDYKQGFYNTKVIHSYQ
jgi:hypothetical protein